MITPDSAQHIHWELSRKDKLAISRAVFEGNTDLFTILRALIIREAEVEDPNVARELKDYPVFDPNRVPVVPENLDAKDAAAYLGKSQSTLYRWRQEKSGPPWVPVAGRPLYKKSKIDLWLEQGGDKAK